MINDLTIYDIICLGVNKAGVQRFDGHLYYFSWLDSDPSVR